MGAFPKNISNIYDFIRKGARLFFDLINPQSENEDSRRREFILNTLLLGSIFLSFLTTISALSDFWRLGKLYTGVSPIFPLLIFFTFIGLLFLSRKGHFIAVSYLFIGIYSLAIFYAVYKWGVDFPQGPITFALIIVISSILLGTGFSFVMIATISIFLVLFFYLQINSLVDYETGWRKDFADFNDVLVFIFTLIVITIVSWLSNREIEKSLQRARRSEADLQKERDSLEIKVVERTRELRELQAEKMLQMHRFAEFGKMSGGLFHDLVNPLTAALLSVDEFKRKYGAELKEKSLDLEKILRNVNRMKIFTEAARKQMQNQDLRGEFSPTEEISMALETLSYKARGAKVNLIFAPRKNIYKIYGNQIKFYRLMCDLISNAIDSYKSLPKSEDNRQVEIRLAQDNDNIIVSVKDHGCGIKKDDKDKIFQPLFTTKEASEGTGLGLFICKNTVEKDFGGKIELESEEGKGTTFAITMPLNTNYGA